MSNLCNNCDFMTLLYMARIIVTIIHCIFDFPIYDRRAMRSIIEIIVINQARVCITFQYFEEISENVDCRLSIINHKSKSSMPY